MKVKLLKRQKEGEAGEIVEVSPAHFDWLVSLGFAVPVKEAREQAETPVKAEAPAEKPEPKAVKKTAKKK